MPNLEKSFSLEEGIARMNEELSDFPFLQLLVGSTRSLDSLTKIGLIIPPKVLVIDEFSSHPTRKDVTRAAAGIRITEVFRIIAVGGGSAIDFAKGLVFQLTNLGGACERFVAIPTTAGSGSECTSFATFWDDGAKQSLIDDNLLPDHVIYVPGLLKTQNAQQFLSSTSDTVAHCFDTLWNRNCTQESKNLAESALVLISPAVQFLGSEAQLVSDSALFQAQQAAALAGKAININKTSLSHALSYPLTSLLQIPHGLAAGLTLSSILGLVQRLDLEWAGSKLEMGLQDIAKTVSSEVRKSLSEKLSEIRSLVPQLAATTLGYERAGNFTRKVSGADLEDILYSSLGS
jgi:alcohol dehydrogenase class IV